MSVQSAAENELDVTAELPVLDVAAYEAATAELKKVDAPAAVSNLHSLSDNLREVEERLRLKGERLAEIERALAQANAARAAAVEKLALQDKSLSLVQADLTRAQALAASYYESLQSMEGRRSIFQEISTSLYWEVDERDVRLNRAEGQLAAAIARSRDLESKLIDGSARIAKLEKTFAERQGELDRGAAEKATLIASVNSLESRLAEANKRLSELEGVEAAGTTQRRRTEQVETELASVRAELDQRSAALADAGTERGEHMGRIAASESRVRELEARIEEQQESVRVLQADSNASVARAKELESDLRAAEDMIHRLEVELRGRVARLDELEKTNQQWRTTVEEARNALTDRDSLIRRLEEETANSAVLLGAIQQRLDSSGAHEIAPDGDKRLLIRCEGDSEVVHVLGRKTSVGRTPENDLQIDAKFVSRHHAVILAGPAHTIIEDLNSTNGVLVNGRRITRQTLKDGDAVMIGKAKFRFAVRPAHERGLKSV